MTLGLISWIAMIFGVSGCYLVGVGQRSGWFLFAIGSSLNGYIGYKYHLYGMLVGCIIYLLLEIKGYVQHSERNFK